MSAELATETESPSVTSREAIPSPTEAFPEFDLDIGAELNPSPTFAHEADIHPSPMALSLPAPAVDRSRKHESGPVIPARVVWIARQEDEEELGDMREATARALEWARKMFGNVVERDRHEKAGSQYVGAEK